MIMGVVLFYGFNIIETLSFCNKKQFVASICPMMKIKINGKVQPSRHKNRNKGIWSLFLIWAIQKNFGSFFTTRSDMQAAQLLTKTVRSDKSVLRIILSKAVMANAVRRKVT